LCCECKIKIKRERFVFVGSYSRNCDYGAAGPIQREQKQGIKKSWRKQKQGIKKPWSRRSNTEETTKQQRS